MPLQVFVEAFFCRDDWIRTSDHTPPRLPEYKAEKYDYQQLINFYLPMV